MAKKTKKQIAIEKRIKQLKKQHEKVSREKKTIQKRIDRERDVRDKQLSKMEDAIARVQAAWKKLDEKALPSTKAVHKATEKLVALEDQIRAQEGKLRAINDPPPPLSSKRPDREAGEETEE